MVWVVVAVVVWVGVGVAVGVVVAVALVLGVVVAGVLGIVVGVAVAGVLGVVVGVAGVMTNDQRRDEAHKKWAEGTYRFVELNEEELREVSKDPWDASWAACRTDAIAEVLGMLRSPEGRRMFIDNSHGVAVNLLEEKIK